jgi:hypothetical protein
MSKEFAAAGRYVKATDPNQFKNICSIIRSNSLVKVGQYLEMVDPEMFESIVEGK